MIRGSSNIESARAWVFSQFAVANISSAILVSSNPTNLVLAGAFRIKFIDYTANIIVPVLATAAVLCPCLLFVVFRSEQLVPRAIGMHRLPDEEKDRDPVNPNVPFAGAGEARSPVAEILNPFLDRRHAAVSCTIMVATLVAILLINAVTASRGGHPTPVLFVSVPAAVLCFACDLASGWRHRAATRALATRGRLLVERAEVEQELRRRAAPGGGGGDSTSSPATAVGRDSASEGPDAAAAAGLFSEKAAVAETTDAELAAAVTRELDRRKTRAAARPATLVSRARAAHAWWRETFPAASVVLARLPFPLVPFAFSMFVLVEGLVAKGWVSVFGYGWDAWVQRTGVMGAVAGMAFLAVVLSNVSFPIPTPLPPLPGLP